MEFLLVDDHPYMREGVAAALRELHVDAQLRHASAGAQALEWADQQAAAGMGFAAALVDLNLPGMSGLQVVESLRLRHPTLPVLMLSASESPADVRQAMAAGAAGYCPKSASYTTLVNALRLVMAGQVYLPPLMLNAAPPWPSADTSSTLTERQLEVLRLVGSGEPNKSVARRLGLEEQTVKGHLTAIFKALGTVNRVQAIQAARAAGLLP